MTLADQLLTPEAVRDPYPLLAEMRRTEPVQYSERFRSWFVLRHDDVSEAFRDPRFSSDRISGFVEAKLQDPSVDEGLRRTFAVLARWMVFKDPPDHSRLRRLVSRAFTPRAVEEMRGRIEHSAQDLLDDIVEAGGEADLVSAFAFPIPAIVIAEMLGVPPGDRDRFKVWSDQLNALVFGNLDDPGRHARATEGMDELVAYLDRLVQQAQDEPRDDLMTALVRARDEGDALTHDEVIATCVLLLFGGHETTTNLIATGIHHLIEHPEQLAWVRDDSTHVRGAVEEMLRYDGPAKAVVREVGEDLELRGRRLQAGQRVFLVPAAANRDPDVFERPDEFDVTRDANNHLGFGIGIHYCLGAPLARLEATIAIQAVLERLGALEHVDEALEWHPVLLNRGPKALRVRFDALSQPARPA